MFKFSRFCNIKILPAGERTLHDSDAKLQRYINVGSHAYSPSSLVKVDACSDWRVLKKLKNRKISDKKKKRIAFVDNLDDHFDISHANALDKIVCEKTKLFSLRNERRVDLVIWDAWIKHWLPKKSDKATANS